MHAKNVQENAEMIRCKQIQQVVLWITAVQNCCEMMGITHVL